MTTVFRPYSGSEGLRSDRSAGDRLRHRQKVREAIRENVADIIAEEAILTKTPDRVVKVPIRGIKEYRFAFDDKAPRVAAAGAGEVKEGQVVGAAPKQQDGLPGAGDRPGLDYYETDITIEELVDLMFEDLKLPELERKKLRENLVDHGTKRRGYRRGRRPGHLHRHHGWPRLLAERRQGQVHSGPVAVVPQDHQLDWRHAARRAHR